MNLLTQPVFALYAACSGALILILYGLGFWTATVRARTGALINAEDVKVNPKGSHHVEVEHPDVARIKRAHGNAIENAVPFFAIGLLYSLTQPSLTTARVLFLVFVGVRLFHAFFYLAAKQPFRTLSFAVGGVINIIMVVQVLRAVLPAIF